MIAPREVAQFVVLWRCFTSFLLSTLWLSKLLRRMLRVNVFLYFFLLIPSEAQVQTKGASTEAKETECTKVISLSLAANSDSKVFFQQPYYSYHKQNTFFCFRPQQEDPKPIDEELMKILRVGNWLSNCRIMISDSTVVCLGGRKGSARSFYGWSAELIFVLFRLAKWLQKVHQIQKVFTAPRSYCQALLKI